MYDHIFNTISKLGLDAYLMYDFRGSNFISRRVLKFNTFTTRRWVAVFTRENKASILIPKLEESLFNEVTAQKYVYSTYGEFQEILKNLLKDQSKVAIEYSPQNDIPVLDILPAGFVELLKSVAPGTEFVSSADLTQYLAATWGEKAYKSHQIASTHLKEILFKVMDYIKSSLAQGKKITDYDARQFIVNEYKTRGLFADEDICIVSTNERTGNPHYWPTAENNHIIAPNSVLLIDIWAKLQEEGSVYSDSTFMAWIGPDPVPQKVQEVWDIVKTARDIGIETATKNINNNLMGYQIDRAVRDYIDSKGYGQYFVHRTGHSIDSNDHGNGANIDDFETHDTRFILPDTGFSIEPGIYMPEFGMRSEIDIYVHPDNTPEVSTFKQDDLFIL